MSTKNTYQGFTIVELLIVVVVIAILAAITIVSYNGISQRAKESVLKTDLRSASTQLELDKTDTGSYPATESAANNGKGLKKSEGTTFQYTGPGDLAGGYCLSATNGAMAFHIASGNGSLENGVCSGHNSVALNCPTGYIQVPGNSAFDTSDFCIMKYHAKNVGGVATSQAGGLPWMNISQVAAAPVAEAACNGCHLVSDKEWMTLAANVLSVASNWSGGAVGAGYIYSGHTDNSPAAAIEASTNDADGYYSTGNSAGQTALTNGVAGNAQCRTLTLTNGEVIWDMAGNAWNITSASIAGGQQPGITGETYWSWKEWTNSAINWKGLAASSRPSAVSSAAASWSTAQGIGALSSFITYGNPCTYFRGGGFGDGVNAGVLSLNMAGQVTSGTNGIGFRVAK